MKRFVLFAIALIAIALVLQALVRPQNPNSAHVARFQYKNPPATSTAAPATVAPSPAATEIGGP